MAGGGRNAVSGASQESEWEGTGTLGKLKAKFGNIQVGLERSCNLPSCVISSRNCPDEICKLFFSLFFFFMVGLFPSHSLFHNATGSFSMPDSRLVLPCLPTQRAIALIKSSSLSLLPLSLALWLPILEG